MFIHSLELPIWTKFREKVPGTLYFYQHFLYLSHIHVYPICNLKVRHDSVSGSKAMSYREDNRRKRSSIKTNITAKNTVNILKDWCTFHSSRTHGMQQPPYPGHANEAVRTVPSLCFASFISPTFLLAVHDSLGYMSEESFPKINTTAAEIILVIQGIKKVISDCWAFHFSFHGLFAVVLTLTWGALNLEVERLFQIFALYRVDHSSLSLCRISSEKKSFLSLPLSLSAGSIRNLPHLGLLYI